MVTNPGRSVAAIVAVAILALFTVVAIPVIQGVQGEPVNETFIQEEGDVVQPAGDGRYKGLLDTVDDISGDATVNITDIPTGESEVNTIAEGNSSEYNVNGNRVTVFYNEQVSTSEANLTYRHPVTYGFGPEAKAIFGVLDILVLAFLLVVSMFLLLGGGGL